MTAQAIIHDSIDAAVRRRAREHADDIAVVDPYRHLTWSDLDAAADRLAASLSVQGVGRGDRVAWLGPNVAAYPITVLAAWRRGASIVGLNLRLPAADLAAMTQAVHPAHLVYDAHYSELAAALDVPSRTVADPDDEVWPPVVSAGDAGVDRAAIDTDADDEALIYFTSGSTGHPKAVPLTRGAIEATLPYAAVHRFDENSRALVIPPNSMPPGQPGPTTACTGRRPPHPMVEVRAACGEPRDRLPRGWFQLTPTSKEHPASSRERESSPPAAPPIGRCRPADECAPAARHGR